MSRVDAQGLRSGDDYMVVQADVQQTPMGGYTRYTLEDAETGKLHAISNGHLVLDLVSRGDAWGVAAASMVHALVDLDGPELVDEAMSQHMQLQMATARQMAHDGDFDDVVVYDAVQLLLSHGFDDEVVDRFEEWAFYNREKGATRRLWRGIGYALLFSAIVVVYTAIVLICTGGVAA